MRTGIIFPQTEFGHDPDAVRDFAQAAEEAGFSHILAYEHVLGAHRPSHPELRGPYGHEDAFLSPFVLYAYMAAVTERIEFVTGILILPQRQTALVAKQAATLDVLSNGRFRLGVGVGWNPVEYVALGEDFHRRGKRVEAQVTLLRKLWTEPVVQHTDEWHTIPAAGIKPLPIQQPIPIWFGGHADAVLRRTARVGDGWFPNYRTPSDAQPALDRLREYARQAGRAPDALGIEARIYYKQGGPEAWQKMWQAWAAAGATHVSVNTMGAGLEGAAAHLQALEEIAQALL